MGSAAPAVVAKAKDKKDYDAEEKVRDIIAAAVAKKYVPRPPACPPTFVWSLTAFALR
jgi:hypothetical protein